MATTSIRTLALGFTLGVVVTALAAVAAMRTLMIVDYDSTKDFDGTVAALEQAIKDQGWVSPGTMDMQANLQKHGVDFGRRIKLVKLCKASYAAEVLTDARHMASLMPCTIAVYEDDAGAVKLAKMNTGLMGTLFGGTIARVMGGKVAADERAMLEAVVKH